MVGSVKKLLMDGVGYRTLVGVWVVTDFTKITFPPSGCEDPRGGGCTWGTFLAP